MELSESGGCRQELYTKLMLPVLSSSSSSPPVSLSHQGSTFEQTCGLVHLNPNLLRGPNWYVEQNSLSECHYSKILFRRTCKLHFRKFRLKLKGSGSIRDRSRARRESSMKLVGDSIGVGLRPAKWPYLVLVSDHLGSSSSSKADSLGRKECPRD